MVTSLHVGVGDAESNWWLQSTCNIRHKQSYLWRVFTTSTLVPIPAIRYNMVQCHQIFHKMMHRVRYNIDQTLKRQKTPNISLSGGGYVLLIVYIFVQMSLFINGIALCCQGVIPGGCFTNVSRALLNNVAKVHSAKNHIHSQNFKLKLCKCAQSIALGTRTHFQLEIIIRSTISAIHKFRENSLESSRNVSAIHITEFCDG